MGFIRGLFRSWRACSKRRPRGGWRRAAKELRRAGWKFNNKRVRRLWRDEGLQVPTKTRKKRLSGVGANVGAMSLIAPNALWAMDFQFDHTIDQRQVKLLHILHEYTSACPATPAHHSNPPRHASPCLARPALTPARPHPSQP